ncbi:MAG: PIN domain-containing protein [Thermoplasmata archaeon]
MRLTVDSFAWIELIRGTRLGRQAGELINRAEQCFTPAIVLAEVAHRCLRDGLDESLAVQELRAMTESSTITPIDSDLAVAASLAATELQERARAQRLRRPGLGDGLVLATARTTASQLLTGDPHFRGLPETVWLA